ncbi:MAG TPA: hypothetical protein VM821_07910, partial [Abditibacteriaceae bacterium]|nr:hypothetical protein [Abditibacteriaceae bacterium]
MLAFAGCKRNHSTPPQFSYAQRAEQRAAGAFETLDPWVLTTQKVDAPRGNRGIFLGNGFLGAGFGANGGSDSAIKCFAAGVYNNEHLAELPQWNKLDLPVVNSSYRQSLDLKRGKVNTRFGNVGVSSFVSLARREVAIIRVEGAPLPPQLPQIAVPEDWIATRVTTVSRHEKVWNLRTTDGKTTLRMHIHEVADSPQSWTRYVWIRPNPNNRVLDVAPPFAQLLQEHELAWAKRWRSDIQIEGDAEAQQLVHALMFNLLCCVRAGSTDSIPPEALIGNHYQGHIFWDAEIWMFPALLAQHPELAKTVLDYRFKHLNQARQIARKAGYAGIDFPWESASSGNEVAPPEFARERHITADVGWAHWQYWLWTHDKTWLRTRGWPVISGVADFWASRAQKNAKTGKYDILQVMGPDENGGLVDNNAFTNAMAKSCLENAIAASRVLDIRANPRWDQVAQKLALPFDAKRGIYLKCDNDKARTTKQADGELVIYPADLPMSREHVEHTFDFHRARPIRFGPAMTTSIHALIAARLGRGEQAEKLFRESYRHFVRGPFLLFSEKRSLHRCVFTTGAGGVLQSVLYGFADLRALDFEVQPARKASLPPSWKSLTIAGIKHNGKN